MNAHQRKVKAKAFIAELKACSDDEKVSALLEAGDDLRKLGKENEQLRTTITEQAARIAQLELSHDGWLKKTEWVQEQCKPKDLGKHRADIMNERIKALEDEKSVFVYGFDFFKNETNRKISELTEALRVSRDALEQLRHKAWQKAYPAEEIRAHEAIAAINELIGE